MSRMNKRQKIGTGWNVSFSERPFAFCKKRKNRLGNVNPQQSVVRGVHMLFLESHVMRKTFSKALVLVVERKKHWTSRGLELWNHTVLHVGFVLFVFCFTFPHKSRFGNGKFFVTWRQPNDTLHLFSDLCPFQPSKGSCSKPLRSVKPSQSGCKAAMPPWER